MKKLLSLCLAASLVAALALPAAAEEASAGARLTRVTQAVKTVLELDTDRFEDFQGECRDDELASVWSLRWTNENGEALTVEALEDGTVISYSLSVEDDTYRPMGGNLPAFPTEDTGEEALLTAERFLDKVLSPMERAQLQSGNHASPIERLYGGGRTFYGSLTLNGLPSPLTCSVTVENGRVTRFRRDVGANTFLGDVPAPEAGADRAGAAAALREKLSLRLEYVPSEKDQNRAVLRYLPERDLHTFYVDADSGALLDITELEDGLYRGYKNAAAEDAAAPAATAAGRDGGASLSTVELEGVDKLKDVKTAAQLDAVLRSIDAFGLNGFTLTRTAYSLEKQEGGKADTVLCTLRYTRAAEEETWHRNITVDARTGEVRYLYASSKWGQEAVLTQAQAQERAEAALKALWPDRKTVLYDAADQTEDGAPYYSFIFAREANGYPFSANACRISIDSAGGFVSQLSYTWDENVTFDGPEGAVSEKAALSAWRDTYDVTLAYRLVPRDLKSGDAVQDRLIAQGMRRFYGLRLTYGLERENDCLGIDAKTGLPVLRETWTEEAPAYTDIAGSSARADIEKLARYGVGYDASAFRPGVVLTQWDFVCLLSSVQGGRLDPAAATKEERDMAYSAAYELGALTRAERADGAAVTRGALVKMLLNAAGYGPAAQLTGIYTTQYGDREKIPAGDLGYAAIAQALGLTKGSYAGTSAALRGEAASMLCRILERKA